MARIELVNDLEEYKRIDGKTVLVGEWQEWSVVGKPLPPPDVATRRQVLRADGHTITFRVPTDDNQVTLW